MRKLCYNPLPGFIDSITLEEVEEPAISPFGHVLGFVYLNQKKKFKLIKKLCRKSTWSMCLSQGGNICPFTKKPLHKRDLVLVTWDNVETYRSKIVNWPT